MKIFLTFIFKNESKVLERMLRSVLPLVDGCICTDTGSTDNSKEIIQNLFDKAGKPCIILNYPTDKYGTDMDFGGWRNYAVPLMKGKCDMVFWIDSKEELIISPNFNIEEFKKNAADKDMINITVKTNSSANARAAFFNINKNFYWKEPLHEYLKCKDYIATTDNILEKDLYVQRRLDGFTWTSQTQIQKYTAHAEFFERHIERKKGNSRSVFYCAQSWRDAKEFKKALKWYRKRASIIDTHTEERYFAQFEVGNMCVETGEPINKCIKEYLKCSAMDDLRADHMLEIILLLQKERRWEESFKYSKMAVEKYHGKNPYPQRSLFLEAKVYEHELMDAHTLNIHMINEQNKPIPVAIPGVLNVIWQTPPGDVTTFELEYIQKVLLSKIEYTPFFDNEAFRAVLDNSLIIYSNDTPDISEPFKAYLKEFDNRGYSYYLLHLSNEKLNHNYDYYKKANHVFRGYYDKSITLPNVTFIPIGFKSGFLNTAPYNPMDNAGFIWSFIGQIKSERQVMYNSLKSVNPNFTHLTNYWNCPTALSVEEVIEIYKKTTFIPCPNGWSGVDGGGFRILEALECGCIPIVKYNNNADLYNTIYGEHPFIVTESWETTPKIIMDLINNPDALREKLSSVQEWYADFKIKLADKFFVLITAKKLTTKKSLCIVVPYRNREEHLKQFIPHMKSFLNRKGIDFSILLVEQADSKSFNRAKLLNIGFDYTKGEYDNYCFHDVDMLPLEDADYSHCDNPTHLSSRVEQFNWNLPYINGIGFYEDYFGGVTMFDKDSFTKINGYSNEYWGWGCEDDDCRQRTIKKGIKISRNQCTFRSLSHANNSSSPEYSNNYKRYNDLFISGEFTPQADDGLNGLKYDIVSVIINPDFIHLKVNI